MKTSIRLLILAIVCSMVLAAAPPKLNRLEPWGAQRGKAFRLELYGAYLPEGSQIVSTLPASFTPLAKGSRNSKAALNFLVELKKDAPLGLYPIRLETPTGVSNVMLFSVGEFPDVAEAESSAMDEEASNDAPEQAQSVERPVAVNGRLRAADRDVYRFEAKAGERVVIEVEARRMGSAIDPVIRLLDADGRQLAINNDAATLGLDSRLLLDVPKDGAYFVAVHDARYSNQSANFYRLKIGDFDFADGFFPLGGRRGEMVEVEWFGGSLEKPVRQTADLSNALPNQTLTTAMSPGKPGALPVPFTLSDRDEVVESSNRMLRAEQVLNGKISEAGETDAYKLSVKPGQRWRIVVQAPSLGASQLYPLLSVYGPGKTLLARGGDEVPEKRTTSLEENTFVSRDPFVNVEIPEGVEELTVVVEDLVQRGGPAFGYRLLAEQGTVDFDLTLNTPHVNIPAGGTVYVSATAVRRGYGGAVQLQVEGGDESLKVEGGYIPPAFFTKDLIGAASAGTLALSVPADAKQGSMQLSVWGQAVGDDDVNVRRRASGPGLVASIASRKGIRARELPARADWLGMDLPAAVGEGLPARIEIVGPSNVRIVKGVEYPLRWKLVSTDPEVKKLGEFRLATVGALESTFSPRDPEAEIADDGSYIKYLRTTMGAPEQTFNVMLTAEAMIAGITEQIAAPPITIQVVQGYTLQAPRDAISLAPGESTLITGRVERDSAFSNAVTVEATDLPKGVACESAAAPAGVSDFELKCSAAPTVEPGEYEVMLSSSSFLAGRGEGKNVPYKIDPVPVSLTVPDRSRASR